MHNFLFFRKHSRQKVFRRANGKAFMNLRCCITDRRTDIYLEENVSDFYFKKPECFGTQSVQAAAGHAIKASDTDSDTKKAEK